MTMSTDNRPEILRKLDGNWVATGDVMGKPVQYNVTSTPALQGQFTEISMNDVQVPSQYEARIFIGFDSESNQIIAHWMDSFGAQYSIPHGTGSISENTIEFIVPYWTLAKTLTKQEKSAVGHRFLAILNQPGQECLFRTIRCYG